MKPRFGKPAIYGAYLLASTETGEPLALIDAPKLTVWRTAGASALASRFLSRADASRLLLVGAGVVVGLAIAIAGGTWWYNRTYSPAALALAEMRSLPLVGLVIADESSVVNRLRASFSRVAASSAGLVASSSASAS